MPGKILLSTAYLPPVDYFSLIQSAGEVFIEKKENYHKQSFRNRCYIISPDGPLLLSVPVLEGSRHKIPISEARIDYSKRWQQVHLRAISSSYRNSPYFEFYFEEFEEIIWYGYEYLWDLNEALLKTAAKIIGLGENIYHTTEFMKPLDQPLDFRYRITPGYRALCKSKSYIQVFQTGKGFVPNLSIIDLIFAAGPDASDFL